jgi:hypothetical protein
MMVDEANLLILLKQARTALKTDRPDVALARVRNAIRMIEPKPLREPSPKIKTSGKVTKFPARVGK